MPFCICIHEQSINANFIMPAPAARALKKLGQICALHVNVGKSLRSWATRMNVSVPTLQRAEKGDPSVGMGVYATALWLLDKSTQLGDLADPRTDEKALALDMMRARGNRP